MCGRFVSARKRLELLEEFGVERDRVAASPDPEPAPDYNVAPTKKIFAVLERPAREEEPQARELRVLRWGLVPSWAKDPKVGSRFINARRETVGEKPAFRAAYQRRRCLVPADGYFEWQQQGGHKQPYFLAARDRAPLAMAGLYEVWKAPDESLLWTCTIITTEAADELGHIHDRTPLLVPRDAWSRWLDPEIEDPGQDLLVPGTPGVLDAWPVPPAVGNVKNNGPELVEPWTPEEQQLF